MATKKKRGFASRLLKVLGTVALCAVFTALFCVTAFAVYIKFSPELSVNEFSVMAKAQDRTTKLYYMSYTDKSTRTGSAVEIENEALYQDQNREWVRYKNIPKDLINAFVSIEDHRFFEHNGIDLRRTAGAVLGFVTGKSGYGGSTLTQQLIKNVTGDDEHSVNRKIKEIVRAKKLNKALSKEEIMELYLNTIYLSNGCYGIGAASEKYFGKDASELTLAECAALACIPQSPTKWDPAINPENNAERRKTVLYRMNELGYIDESQLEAALSEQIKTVKNKKSERNEQATLSWYTESVIEESLRLLTEKGIASSRVTAAKLLYTGGLSVITAQDPKMQKAVSDYFETSSNFYSPSALIHPECSMVVIDPENGDILALAGATGKKTMNRTLNYATGTLRSPGSSIKPLSVYAPAVDKGILTYGSVIDDTPVRFVNNGRDSVRPWPRNYPEGYRGLTTVRDAVARSVNTVAVKALGLVGKDEAFRLLHDELNMKHLIEGEEKGGNFYTDIAESPLALGQLTKGITVAEITAGYTALCNGGSFSEARTVLKILDRDGNVLVDNVKAPKKVFSEQTATIMTKLLQGVTSGGTASSMSAKRAFDCAGKTGTTNNDHDRWFIGYTPDLLAGVWFGYSNPKSLTGYPTSPSPALSAWDDVMKIINTSEYLGREPKKHFTDADGIIRATYCRDSGKLLSSACACDPRGSRAETGYFTAETVPKSYCDCHVLVNYDTLHGGVASPSCPMENCRRIGLLNVERAFPKDVIISDAQYTYRPLGGRSPCVLSTEPFYLTLLPRGLSPGHSATSYPFNRYCGCYFEREITDTEMEDEYEG